LPNDVFFYFCARNGSLDYTNALQRGSKLSFSLWIYKINLGNLLVTAYVMWYYCSCYTRGLHGLL